jgi:rubrerythrin
VLSEDGVCCAEVRYDMKCKQCGKRTTAFVVPYGKCFLCGGELEVVESINVEDPERVTPIKEALQFEVNAYIFYRMAREKTANLQRQAIFAEMEAKERDHVEELIQKYHIHPSDDMLKVPESVEAILADELFAGVDFESVSCIKEIYEKAIELERRTYEYFKKKADSLPDGLDKELYRELAAEEEEHIAILETEMEQLES